MQTPWGLIKTHDAPESQGVPSFVAVGAHGFVSMSIGGGDATPDDLGVGCDIHIPDNDDEAPFAWRDRRPTY